MATIEFAYDRLLDRFRGLGDVIIGAFVWLVALSFAVWAIVAEMDGPVAIFWAAVFALILGAGGLMFRYDDTLRRRGDDLIVSGLWANILVFGAWAILTRTDAFAVGVVTGRVLALGAIGLTLIYGILKFAHFAHGDSMMLAAYIAFFALTGTLVGERRDTRPLPWSLNDLPGGTDSISWPAQLGGGIVIFAIASLGIAIAMRSLIIIFWGTAQRFYAPGIRPTTDLPFDVRIVTDQIFIFFAAMALAALVYVLLFRTKLGKAMRAVSDNPELAEVSGINPEQIIRWTWLIGGALVAVAGVMLALQAQLKPELGFILLLPLFAATILGGIGSPQGAFVGAMIVGVTQEVFAVVGPDIGISSGYKFSVAFVMLIMILLLRPRGLFGAKT